MSISEISIFRDLVDVLADPGTWVFAAGSAVISALFAWVISRLSRAISVRTVCLVSATIPTLGLIGAIMLARPGQQGLVTTFQFLARPDVLFGLAIWLLAGWLSARAVCWRIQPSAADSEVAIFE